MKTKTSYFLEKEDMINPSIVPNWVMNEYHTFQQTITNKTFSCFFGMSAEKSGELRYSYINYNDLTS